MRSQRKVTVGDYCLFMFGECWLIFTVLLAFCLKVLNEQQHFTSVLPFFQLQLVPIISQ